MLNFQGYRSLYFVVLNRGMSNVVEPLSSSKLGADLRDGTKFYAESQGGEAFAVASRGGAVAVWTPGESEVRYLNLQPVKKKNKAEAELQGIWLSQSGDLLYVATSVDIVAVNTYTKTVAWEYQQKRQWGFLVSIPQGGYLLTDDEFVTFYSSGEVVQLDRKARVLRSEEFQHSPRMIVKNPNSPFAFGSDGHVIWRWDAERGFGSREMILQQPCYSLQMSDDGDKIAIRAMNKVAVFKADPFEELITYPSEAGLPQLAMNANAEVVAQMAGSRVIFRNLSGVTVGAFEIEGEIPVSIHSSKQLNELVVGMRSGTVYSTPWPV